MINAAAYGASDSAVAVEQKFFFLDLGRSNKTLAKLHS